MKFKMLFFPFLITILLGFNCGAPHHFWPQHDISESSLNDPSFANKILIASSNSESKQAVIGKVKDTFRNQSIYIKIVGINQLKNEDYQPYSAILIINTCMAGRMDNHIDSFLTPMSNQSKIIVLTTSGDGGWFPDKNKYHFNAISSASNQNEVEIVANRIIDKLNSLLQ